MGLGVGGNLFVLFFFKYAVLLLPTFFSPDQELAQTSDLYFLPLPVGVSFFTFQGISLVIDRFRSSDSRKTTWLEDFNYLSFFPQLIAGPIVRGTEFLGQIKSKSISDISWVHCYRYLVLGYFLKRVVADNLHPLTKAMSYEGTLNYAGVDLIALVYAYGIQIFSDFAGYSFIAMGLAGLFGYRLPLNFRIPYLTSSFSEFWRHWHITLSRWLRDYLYIPLGGNRSGKARTYLNLLLVMTLGGLWHGASWNFLFWGLAHGIFLTVERLFKAGKEQSRVIKALNWMRVYLCVNFAWLLFVMKTPSSCYSYLQATWHNLSMTPNLSDLYLILFFSFPVWCYHFLWTRPKLRRILEPYLYGLLLFFIATESGDQNSFVYFRF